jgi:hypothetical protein
MWENSGEATVLVTPSRPSPHDAIGGGARMADSHPSIGKVCEYCKSSYVPSTTRPCRIKVQRFCSPSCATRCRMDRLAKGVAPERRKKRNHIPVGLFDDDAQRIERQRQYSRDYYWRNREQELARGKSEHRKAKRREWYQRNKAKCSAASNAWRRKNAKRIRENDRLRVRDKEKRRRYMLKWHYGVTWEWVQETLITQDNKCAICRDPLGEKPCVDHDHATKAVRGLLCSRCNKGIGALRENPRILSAAIEYLWRHTGCRVAS